MIFHYSRKIISYSKTIVLILILLISNLSMISNAVGKSPVPPPPEGTFIEGYIRCSSTNDYISDALVSALCNDPRHIASTNSDSSGYYNLSVYGKVDESVEYTINVAKENYNPYSGTVSVNFRETVQFDIYLDPSSLYSLTTSTNPSGAGTISLDPSGGQYSLGTTVTATVRANNGYEFDHWSGDTSGSSSSVEIRMTSNKTITANFNSIPIQYTLATSVNPSSSGTITLNPPGGIYDPGTIVSATASPNSNYIFDGWSGDISGSTTSIQITMDSDKSIIANFYHNTNYAVWVTDCNKVFQDKTCPSNPVSSIDISCARNEYEPFQVAIRAYNDLNNINIEISDLIDQSNGEEIESNSVSIYLVEYVDVYSSSDGYPGGSHNTGYWPDPLPPYEPFDLTGSKTQPIWFVIYVTAEMEPGLYNGEITINPQNSDAAIIPISLKVWNFILSDEKHSKTAFGLQSNKVKQFHNIGSEEFENIVRDEYYESYYEHSTAPGFIESWYYKALEWEYNEQQNNFIIDYSKADELASLYLEDYNFNSFMIGKNIPKTFCGYENFTSEYNQKIIAFWNKVSTHLESIGLLDKGYYFILDEPYIQAAIHGGDGMYYVLKIKDFAQLLEAANPDIKIAQTLWSYWDAPYDELKEYVDIWIPNIRLVSSHCLSDIEASGAEAWFYNCIQPQWPFPNYFIDHPVMSPRIFSWMQWKYGITGNLYYSTTSWAQNPWIDPVNANWHAAGEGFLLYPPFKEETSPTPCLEGPISSIRWEMNREGIEDYEYFWLLSKYIDDIDEAGTANQNVLDWARTPLSRADEMVTSFSQWSTDLSKVYEIRADIAQKIEHLVENYLPYNINPPDTTITSGPSGLIDQHDVSFIYNGLDDATSSGNLKFSYKLQGHDIRWSSFTYGKSVSYDNLPSGEYVFKVKAKDGSGNVDFSPAETSFTVNDAPAPDFIYTPINPTTSDVIVFQDTSTDDFEDGIINWNWDLGDGTTDKGHSTLYFDGGDRVDITNSNDLFSSCENSMSVEAWIYDYGGGGISNEIYGTDAEIGWDNREDGKNVKKAVPANGSGYMGYWNFTGDENVQRGYSWLFPGSIMLYSRPLSNQPVVRVEIWNVDSNTLLNEYIYYSDYWEDSEIGAWTSGYLVEHSGNCEALIKVGANYSYRYYYFGNVDVAIDHFSIDRYHQRVIQKGSDWRVYSYGDVNGKMIIQFLVWHPDSTYTHKNVNLGLDQYRKWHHIVCSYEQNNKMKIYVDGELKGSWDVPDKAIRQVTKNPYLGLRNEIELKNIRIYNRVLSDSEILNNFNGQLTTSGLVSWLKLNEGFGKYISDSINENIGTINGAEWRRYVEHKYNQDGIYPVTLTVEDIYGITNSITKNLNIGGGPSPPNINDVFPPNQEEDTPPNPELSIDVFDNDNNDLKIIFKTNASGSWQTIQIYNDVQSGTYTASLSEMNNWLTTYYWSVHIFDGTTWVNYSYSFKTKPADWDVSIDNKIDINDITGATFHFGESGEPGWIRADVVQDGIININDITAITAHYGEDYD